MRNITNQNGAARSVVLVLALISTGLPHGEGLLDSSVNINANKPSGSPWDPSYWKITLNIGRERGSWMPEEWGASGNRLVLSPMEVEITSERTSGEKEDPMLMNNAWKVKPKTDTSYVTMEGKKTASFGVGGWKIRMPSTSNGRGHASKIMCYLDLQSDVKKNDVFLKKGERIYLTGKCWREDDLENALDQMLPIFRDYIGKQETLESQLEHDTGDRRLDGADPIQTLLGMKDIANLVLERDEALRRYEEAKKVYPSLVEELSSDPYKELHVDDLNLQEGPWPGQIEWLTLEPKTLFVRRINFMKEEYHLVGTWNAEPLFHDEEDTPSIF